MQERNEEKGERKGNYTFQHFIFNSKHLSPKWV